MLISYTSQNKVCCSYSQSLSSWGGSWPSSSFVFALLPLSASAKCGNVDYSWGADVLAGMHDYVVTMMLYVLYLTYAVAAVMVIISALQIYIKMNTGEDGVTKSILTLIGACLFMIGASILFPAFFGYQI